MTKSNSRKNTKTLEMDDGTEVVITNGLSVDTSREITREGKGKVVLSPAMLGVGRMRRLQAGKPFDLVIDLCGFFARYLVVTEDQLLIIALWTLHTYIYDRYPQSPFLLITAPEYNCGKSRVLEAIELLCRKPLKSESISSASLYKIIEERHPTFLLDELDIVFNGKGDNPDAPALRGILNAGVRKNATVIRSPNNVPKEHNVYCPKALAGRVPIPESITSRAVPIQMKKDDSGVFEAFRERRAKEKAEPLRERIQTWADQADLVEEPPVPPELDGRRADLTEPLFAVADDLGWGRQARSALVRLLTEPRIDSEEELSRVLLRDIKQWFDANHDRAFVLTEEELVPFLNELEEAPWKKENRGDGIDTHDIAKHLKRYGVTTGRKRWPPTRKMNPKAAYRRLDLEPEWKRYRIG